MTKKKSRAAPATIETASPKQVSEALYFARKCGLTPDEALRMIREAQEAPRLKVVPGGKHKH